MPALETLLSASLVSAAALTLILARAALRRLGDSRWGEPVASLSSVLATAFFCTGAAFAAAQQFKPGDDPQGLALFALAVLLGAAAWGISRTWPLPAGRGARGAAG